MPYNVYSEDDDDRKDALYDALLTAPAPDATSAPDALTQFAEQAQPSPTAGLMDKPYAATPSPTADMDAATAYGDELDQRRADAMSAYTQAAAQETGGPSVGSRIGDFLGDNAVGLLGSFIDLAANKGRNIPGILTTNAAAAEQSRKARGEAEDRALDFQLRAQGQRAQLSKAQDAADRDQAYKQALARHWADQQGNATANIAARERGLDLRERKVALDTEPDHPVAVALRQQLYKQGKVPDGSLDGLPMAAMRTNPVIREQVDLAYKEAGIPVEARRAAATAGAGAQATMNVETSPANVAAQAAAAADIARARETAKVDVRKPVTADDVIANNPRVKWNSKDSLARYIRDPQTNSEIQEGLQIAAGTQAIYGNMLTAAREMQALPLYKRLNKLDPDRARILSNMKTHVNEFKGVMGAIAKQNNVALSHEVEELTPDIVFNPVAVEVIKGFKHGLEGGTTRRLGPYGGHSELVDPLDEPGGEHGQPAPAAAPAPAAPPKAKPPSQPPAPGMIHMQKPDGSTGWVKPGRKDELLRKKWTVIP